MDKVRLNPFDLFAYVASGLAALLCADLLLDSHVVRGVSELDAYAVLVLFAGYVAGHVVAIPASILMEEVLLGVLRWPRPSVLLFEPEKAPLLLRVMQWLRLTEFGKPLDPDIVRRVKDRFKAEGRAPGDGAARYWAVYPSIYAPVGKHQPASPRVEVFGQLYAFARNLGAVALLFGVAEVAAHLRGHDGTVIPGLDWKRKAELGAALFAALTLRFLKFYRLHTAEMFIVYSQGSQPAPPEAPEDA